MTESPTVGRPGSTQLLVEPATIRDAPRKQMYPGVTSTMLWREGGSVAGILHLDPGAEVPEHTHRHAEHHVWSVEGQVRVDGRTVGPGAYWHAPAGVVHACEAVGAGPVTLFYLYLERSG